MTPEEFAKLLDEYDECTETDSLELMYNGLLSAFEAKYKEVDRLIEFVDELTKVQPEALRICRENGFVFDSIGVEKGNWQHLAFTIYTMIAELDNKARALLAELKEGA